MKQHFENVCPCCGRHCPADNLHCRRGKAYFGQETGEIRHNEGKDVNIKDRTVMLMLKCGHLLHHDFRERAENEDILYFLSDTEKSELASLLKKCIDAWENN